MGGVVKAVAGVVNAVAPIASLIPGVGMFAMAAQAATNIAGKVFDAMDKKRSQDAEDDQTTATLRKTTTAFQNDVNKAADVVGGIANTATKIFGGGLGGFLGLA